LNVFQDKKKATFLVALFVGGVAVAGSNHVNHLDYRRRFREL
jgi:hypothetical protein